MPSTLAALGALALFAALGLPQLGLPGPYYDEVIQALPALELVEGAARAEPLPGAEAVRVGSRSLPWRIQPYMGALKSQLLAPVFALAGDALVVLRATTWAWGALALLLTFAFARRALGTAPAVFGILLAASDPSIVFLSRHDWGSFAVGFALRGAALLFAWRWWEDGRPAWALLAGAALGLGIYNKIDFAVFPAAAALALLAMHPRAVATALRARPAAFVGAGALALVLALPVLVSLLGLAETAARFSETSSLAEKLRVHAAVWDGSYFWRLQRVGGRFDAMFAIADAPRGALAAAALVAALGLALAGVRRRAPSGTAFVLGCSVLLLVLLLLVPGANRPHHVLNAAPFPHWVLALGLAALWRPGAVPDRWRAARRVVAALVLGAVVASNLALVRRTHAEIATTGGRGLWTDALRGFARDTAALPGARVVCLDWGFHAPLAMLAPQLPALDAIWSLRDARSANETWELAGDARTVYLIHAPPYDVFWTGVAFRRALAGVPDTRRSIHAYADRTGDVAFRAVRIEAPHRLRFARGAFDIVLGTARAPTRE